MHFLPILCYDGPEGSLCTFSIYSILSNYNENTLPSAGDCSMQQIVKDKEDCASIPVSSTKVNKHIVDYRQQKRQRFDLFQKTTKSKVSDEICTTTDPLCIPFCESYCFYLFHPV